MVGFNLVLFFTFCFPGRSSSSNCRGEWCQANPTLGLLPFGLKGQACCDSRAELRPVSGAGGGESVFSVA